MERVVHVAHKAADLFEITVRQHIVLTDQPLADGGTDLAPTPTELFVASLASCVAFYARRYLVRHSLPTEGLAVTATFGFADRPTRVGEIHLSVTVPKGVPDGRRAAMLAVASHCTVHNSLDHVPRVSVELAA